MLCTLSLKQTTQMPFSLLMRPMRLMHLIELPPYILSEAGSHREQAAKDKLRNVKDTLPKKSSRDLDLAAEKGSSTWLPVIPL